MLRQRWVDNPVAVNTQTSDEIEKALLGCLMFDWTLIYELNKLGIETKSFRTRELGEVWNAVTELIEDRTMVSPLTVACLLEAKGVDPPLSDHSGWFTLVHSIRYGDYAPIEDEVRLYGKIIKEAATKRILVEAREGKYGKDTHRGN